MLISPHLRLSSWPSLNGVFEVGSFCRVCLPLGCVKELSLKLFSMRCAEGSYDVMELDAMEILAEHTHFCEICNKGERSDR
jgi:hypothetical protein